MVQHDEIDDAGDVPEDAAPFFRCNGERIYLDPGELVRRNLRLGGAGLSEQCEGCGEDVADQWVLVTNWGCDLLVECGNCCVQYRVEDAP